MTDATCGQYVGGGFDELTLSVAAARRCGAPDARPYLPGLCCPLHTPAAIAGRPEPYVDADLTLEALKRRAGRLTYVPPPADSSLLDERAINSGKRRSTPRSFRAAQRAEYDRRLKREGLKE